MSTRPSPPPAAAPTSADPASVAPVRGSEAGAVFFLRNLDLLLIPMAVPVVLLLGAPVLGVLVGAVLWVGQRLIELGVARVAQTKDNVRVAVGYNLGVMVGRAWLVGLTILAVGTLGDRQDGLAAAILVFVAFTIYFAGSLLARSFERNPSPS